LDSLAQGLLKELNVETVFSIPIFGGIKVPESVVVTWIIMIPLFVFCFFISRNLKVDNPGRKQLLLESIYLKIYGFFESLLGEKGRQYIYYLMAVAIYIGVANVFGIFGFKPPTKDLGVTAALAILSILLIEISGIRARGVKGWAKSFAEPLPIIAPLNVLEILIRPLSLCMRLFGNVLGSFVVMKLLEQALPAVVPGIFSLYFDIFDGLIQAYVFVFLTSLFIREAINADE